MSVQAAAEHYGVVIDAETFEVDVAATEKLRANHPSVVVARLDRATQ